MGITANLGQESSAQKVIRLFRPSVVILCGPAACGKSTFAARHFRPTQVISSDQARALVCDDERDQRFQLQAFALVHFLIEQRLSINRLCVVDSTALTLSARKYLLELAWKYQVPCVVVVLNVPLEKCLERDQMRERSVGRAIIERHYQQFEQAKASLPQEGFDQIFELADEELATVRFETLFRPVPVPPRATRVDSAERDQPPIRTPRPAMPGRSFTRDARPVSAPRPSTPPTPAIPQSGTAPQPAAAPPAKPSAPPQSAEAKTPPGPRSAPSSDSGSAQGQS